MIITVFKRFTGDFDVSIQRKIYNVNIIKAQNKINDYEIEVEYKISDVKKYHYSQKEYLKEVELQFEKVDNISPEEIQNILIDKANLLGVEIIKIKIFK